MNGDPQARLDITVWTGRTFTKVLRLIDRNKDYIDLTGYSVAAKIKTAPGGTLIVAMTGTITDASNGEITLTIDDSATAALTAQNGVWDIMLTDGSSNKLPPYVGGNAVIKASVTD